MSVQNLKKAACDGTTVASSVQNKLPKTVCILLFFDAFEGGAELHTVQMAAFLKDCGVCVTLVVKPEQRDGLDKFLNRHWSSPALPEVRECPLSEQMGWSQCWKVLREHPADIYVCPKGGFGSGSVLLEIGAKLLGVLLITIEHQTPRELRCTSRSWLPGVGFWQLNYRVRRWTRSLGPAKILTVSKTARSRFLTEYWYPHNRTVAVPNGVDVDRFVPNPTARDRSRASLDIANDSIVCGMVCRLVEAKAIDVALKAFEASQSCRELPVAHLVIYGDGPLNADLQALSAGMSISNRIHWAGPTTEPWNVYPAIDFFLLSSLQEGLPLGLLEAMAVGCVPVATPVGGVPDVVMDQVNGFLSPSTDAAAFATTLARALRTSAEERELLSKNSVETVRSSFNLTIQMKRLYEQMLETA